MRIRRIQAVCREQNRLHLVLSGVYIFPLQQPLHVCNLNNPSTIQRHIQQYMYADPASCIAMHKTLGLDRYSSNESLAATGHIGMRGAVEKDDHRQAAAGGIPFSGLSFLPCCPPHACDSATAFCGRNVIFRESASSNNTCAQVARNCFDLVPLIPTHEWLKLIPGNHQSGLCA